jgi:PTH2 family peptidyl-tRNA hydrolase
VEELKMMIVMRKDLNMRKGKMISQGGHAASRLTVHMLRNALPVFEQWLASNETKVTVSVNSEEELLGVMYRAEASGIYCELIEDIGKTEFGGVATLTCLGLLPSSSEKLAGITDMLPLL